MIRAFFAFVRGNILCFFRKITNARAFSYHPLIRMFGRARISLRNKGSIRLNKNIKMDEGAFIASNGGIVVLGDNVGVGRNNIIVSHREITVGKGTILSPNVLIYDHDHDFDCASGVKLKDYRCDSVVIGENCWIGANTVILRGTVIGDNCLVGAGCILKGSYPSNSKIIQKRNTTIIGDYVHEDGDGN